MGDEHRNETTLKPCPFCAGVWVGFAIGALIVTILLTFLRLLHLNGYL